jgi:hypothetical protein
MKSKHFVIGLTLICVLLILATAQFSKGQTTTVNIIPSQSNLHIGDTLTINVTVNNVENLYGLDVKVNWSKTALMLVSTRNMLGVESHPGGVLHETAIYPVQVVTDDGSQVKEQYQLVATSAGDAAPFSGSGTIATLTFTVTSTGQSVIGIASELADHPDVGDTTSEPIAHNDIAAIVDASDSTTISAQPSSVPTPSPTVPEFPQTALVAMLIGTIVITLMISRRVSKKTNKF